MTLELSFWHVIQPITLIIVTIIGWGIKAVWRLVKENNEKTEKVDGKIDALRNEIHAELQHYVHVGTCQGHREGINARLCVIYQEYERTLALYAENRRNRQQNVFDTIVHKQERACDNFFEKDIKG